MNGHSRVGKVEIELQGTLPKAVGPFVVGKSSLCEEDAVESRQ